jgi:hypothetical protein
MNYIDSNTPTEKELRRNVLGQGVKILHALMDHYRSGDIELPEHNDLFMGLMVLACEGKVKAETGEDGKILWTVVQETIEGYENVIPFPLSKGKE